MDGRLLRLVHGPDDEWRVMNDLEGIPVSEAQIPKAPKSLFEHDATPESLWTFLTQLLKDDRFTDESGTWAEWRLHAIGAISTIGGGDIGGKWSATVNVIIVRSCQS